MPTEARPDRQLPRSPKGFDRCDCCGALFEVKPRGRIRLYCSDNCRKIFYMLGQLEDAVEELPEHAPKEGLAQIRRRLWGLANQLNRYGRP